MYIISLLAISILSLIMAVVAWRRRRVPGAVPFTLLALAAAQWSFSYAMEFAVPTVEEKLFWAKVEYIGIVLVPFAWFLFSLEYTGRHHWITPRRIALLLVEPAWALLMVWTTEWHGLFYSSVSLLNGDPHLALDVTHGIAFWIHVLYSYLLLFFSTLVLVHMLVRVPSLYRLQSLVVLLGVLAPWAANAAYLAFEDVVYMDFTPFGFVATTVLVGWSLFRLRFLHIIPLAREAVFLQIDDAAFVLDREGHILDMNPAAERLIGRKPSESIGMSFSDVCFHLFATRFEVSKAPQENVELSLVQDGVERQYEVRTMPLYRGGPKAAGYLVLFHDVTPHKQIQQELQKQIKQFRHILRMSETVARADTLEKIFGAALDGLQEVLGIDRAALLLFDEEGITRFRAWQGLSEAYRQAVEGHSPWKRSEENPAPITISDILVEGELLGPYLETVKQEGIRAMAFIPLVGQGGLLGKFMLYYNQPHHFSELEIHLAQIIARQIALAIERHRAHTILERHAKMATLMASLTESLNYPHTVPEVIEAIGKGALRLSGADRVAVYVRQSDNRVRCEWLYGISREYVQQVHTHLEQMPGSRLLEKSDPLLIPDVCAMPETSFFRKLAKREGFRSMALWPLRYEGQTIAAIGCYYNQPHRWDTIERETMESFARQAAVALRNAQLLADLQETNAQLQEALRVREDLLRNVSHELRTPLTLIRGYAELLEDGTLITPDDVPKISSTILRNARHLEHLIDQLLAFQRLRRESKEAMVPIDVASWLRETVTSWQQPLEEKGLALVAEISEDVGHIRGHADYLNQVIYNLLDNARKFSPQGGTITLRCWADEQEVYISVSDEGIGIAPDKLDRVFERFYQVESGSKRRYGGMGLGLALVKEIVEFHGGRVWAESEGEGAGTTFIFTLPRLHLPEQENVAS